MKNTKRLTLLENSLQKKEDLFQQKLDNHFADVKSANGQPLNDKRNGTATFNRWEKQNNSLKNLKNSIEKTQQAIEKEKGKITNVESVELPEELKQLLSEGKITQWRKFPNRFFVTGVQKARLVWIEEKQIVAHQYVSQIPNGTGEYEIFRDIFNGLNNTLNKKNISS